MIRAVHVGVVFQGALFVALVESVRRRNIAATTNAAVALTLALAPLLFETTFAVHSPLFDDVAPELTIWISAAGFLHVLGMLGLYESTWWWDHLTHTVSAALVAALVYAGALIVARPPGGPHGSTPVVIGVTLALTFGAGVFWELIELGAREVAERWDIEPVLVYYGWTDTALDLVFDVVGAALVLAFDVRIFVAIARQYPGATRTALVAGGVIVVAGSLLVSSFLRLSGVEFT